MTSPLKVKKAINSYDDLFWAIDARDMPAIRDWIKKDPNSVNGWYGETSPLDQASEMGNLTLLSLLLKAGANPDEPGPRGNMTAFHYACSRAKPSVVQRLLEHGVNVNIQDNRGMTPLHYAASNDVKIVKMLIEQGADPAIRNKQRESVLDYAKDYTRYVHIPNMVEFLEEVLIVIQEKKDLTRAIMTTTSPGKSNSSDVGESKNKNADAQENAEGESKKPNRDRLRI